MPVSFGFVFFDLLLSCANPAGNSLNTNNIKNIFFVNRLFDDQKFCYFLRPISMAT
jgi:hypothetical protein